jgi:hypothetical protein|tara:strand:+ start:86 stop:469 length:384 start_codon:yes stop_codon:yes gene_type:complete
MREFNNRQMSIAFKKLGFSKSDLQLTRMGISYSHPLSNALFTFAKRMDGGVTSSAPGQERMWSFPLGLSAEKYYGFINAGIEFPWDLNSNPDEMSPREALLCIARGFGKMLEEEAARPKAKLTLVQK